MPHYKCDACKVRLHTPGAPVDPVHRCPECGAALERVTDLAALVGFKSITLRDDAEAPPAVGPWFDDSPVLAGAVALPPPETY